MKRIAVWAGLHALLVLGLLLGNLVSSEPKISIGIFESKKDVLLMFAAGVLVLWILIIYNMCTMIAAVGSAIKEEKPPTGQA